MPGCPVGTAELLLVNTQVLKHGYQIVSHRSVCRCYDPSLFCIGSAVSSSASPRLLHLRIRYQQLSTFSTCRGTLGSIAQILKPSWFDIRYVFLHTLRGLQTEAGHYCGPRMGLLLHLNSARPDPPRSPSNSPSKPISPAVRVKRPPNTMTILESRAIA